jgi:hypothetical protein
VTPSYIVGFSIFPSGSDSEELVILFHPTAGLSASAQDFASTIAQIASTSMLYCSKQPIDIIPLPLELLPKSALGKLSRPKLKIAYETGLFSTHRSATKERIQEYNSSIRIAPTTEVQKTVAALFAAEFNLDITTISISSSLADKGVDSISLIRFKKLLESHFNLATPIPMIAILRSPSISGISLELSKLLDRDLEVPYEPVVELHPPPAKNAKTPIFFIHPGLGEILVFLNIARYFRDRAVFALRAPGFGKGEVMFSSLSELITFVPSPPFQKNTRLTKPAPTPTP